MKIRKTRMFISLLMAFTMVLSGLAMPASLQWGTQKAYAAVNPSNITSWADLNTAIGEGATTITIGADLYADSTITIPSGVTIKGKEDKDYYIYQKKRDKYDTMFKVTGPDGDLTLGSNLILSGKVAKCNDGSTEPVEGEEANNHLLSDYLVTETIGTASGSFSADEGKLSNSSGNQINFVPISSGYDATVFEIENGMLKYNNQYVVTYRNGNYQLNNNSDKALLLIEKEADANGNDVIATSIEEGGEYILKDTYPNIGGYIKWDGNYLVSKASRDEALVLTAGSVTPGEEKYYWKIPTDTPIDDPDNLSTFEYPDQQTAAEAALKTLNEELDPRKFKYVPGADLSVITNKYYYYPEQDKWVNSSGKTIEEAMEEYASQHQGCDDAGCPDGETYTNVTFPDDQATSTTPKGFFVEVSGGGKATLGGATLKNFITSRKKDSAPKHVAPVAVYGAGSTFNVNDGTIKNNIVGYIAKDEKAYESADKIKKYVKGAAPNARRVNPPDRRWADAGIDDGVKGSGITATSGGIIYADGAIGQIKGGSIEFNRGDTGGIMASGTNTKVTLMGDADINNNVGVQFGGGVTTEDDAFVVMYGGTISENVAWFGGGAVYATQNGVEWLLGNQTKAQRKDGKFVMDGGVIESNTAFTRGGGFLVDSNGVSLISGVIKNNMSRMLGGGMYVMGDHPDYSYTVTIVDGYVHENKAVSEGGKGNVASDPDNQILSRKLAPPSDSCGDLTELFNGQMTTSSDDQVDGYPAGQDGTDGTGGGLWLCAYGSTALGLSDDRFIIDKNYASGSVLRGKTTKDNEVYPEAGSSEKAGGNDIHKDTKASGNIVITGIVNDKAKWYDENIDNTSTDAWYTDPDKADDDGNITDFGARNLTNKGDHTPSGYSGEGDYAGVDIFGNLSRRGGGLAGDGTFVLGEIDNIAEAYSELKVTKTWAGDLVPEDVVIRINLEYKDENDNDKVIQVVELPLSELAGQKSELDTTFTDGSETVGGQTVYKGHLVLPITVEDENGKQIQVFDLLAADSGRTFALNTPKGLMGLADHLKTGGKVILSNKERKLTFVELRKDPQTGELVEVDGYEITPTEMKLSSNPAPDFHTEEIVQLQQDGTEEVIGYSITSDIRFEADLTNDKPAEIEKYVNKAVHQNIALDQEFEYDIMAYVKHGTDKLVLTDTLIEQLDFVSSASDVDVRVFDENNSKPFYDINGTAIDGNGDATVAQEGMAFDDAVVEIDQNTKTLKVTIANELEEVLDPKGNLIGYKNAAGNQYLTDLWGKWVRVTYKAQIDTEIQEKIKNGEMTVKDLHSDYVTVKADEKYKPEASIYGKDDEGEEIYRPTPNEGNAPVESDEDHTGLENTASYSLEVKNEPAFEDESNTVTVKPDEPTLEKYVVQAVHKNITLDEEFTYDIIGYITNDADKVVFEDELVSDLEFAGTAQDIEVSYLKDNNHKPYYDVESSPIDGNEDASVASSEWKELSADSTDGLSISATDDGKLTVTIDDEVTVDDGGNITGRKYNTIFGLRGKYVKVSFKARIKKSIQDEIKAGTKTLADLSNVKVKGDENEPVLSDEAHDGIKNDATLKIDVANKGKYNLTSNKVTVKPEQPEIEKYVNQAVHDFIDIDEVFTYDIIAYITKDADEVTITDKLDSQLQFVSSEEEVEVVNLGEDVNHKVTNDINAKQVNTDASVAEKGEEITVKTISIKDGVLTVTLDDADTVAGIRGHWVKITFEAKIKDGLTAKDLEYTKIDATAKEERDGPNIGNDPVLSKESHNGVPNKASYTIGVKNGAEMEEKYKDESNTVTVKPEEFDVEISKQDLEGKELPGAVITITDSEGKEIDKWMSEKEPHVIKLKPGKYKLKEVVAPEGFNRVTTEIEFEVDEDGKVKVLTAKVDNGGKIEVTDINHLILSDAPTPTFDKTVNGGKKLEIESKDEIFIYNLTARIAYVPDKKFVITDDVPDEIEILGLDGVTITVNDFDLTEEVVKSITQIKGNRLTVTPTLEMMKEWGPFEICIEFACKFKDDATITKGESIKNVAVLEVDNSQVEFSDGEDEAEVKSVFDDEGEDEGTKPVNSGDNSNVYIWITLMVAAAFLCALALRRRKALR